MIVFTGCSSDNRFVGSPYHDLTVHAEDNDDSAIVGTLYTGQKAKVIHENWNSWVEIEFNGSKAYVYGGNAQLTDENDERIWLSKGLFKGLGIGIAAIVLIILALAVIGLILKGIQFLFGILTSILVEVGGFAFIGGVLGYFVTHDFNSTIRWITVGAIIGLIFGIIKLAINPAKLSAAGIKFAKDTHEENKRKEAIREAENTRRENEEYPLEIDGTRARREFGGTIIDENGNHWVDEGYGKARKVD